MIEPLKKNGLPNGEGWFVVPDNASYASFIGMPIGNMPTSNPASFSMDIETSYWVLDCLELVPLSNFPSTGKEMILGLNQSCTMLPCFNTDINMGKHEILTTIH